MIRDKTIYSSRLRSLLLFIAFLPFLGLFLFLPKKLFAQTKNYKEGLYVRIHEGMGLGTLELGAISDIAENRPSSFQTLSPFTSVDVGTPLTPNWIIHGGISYIHGIDAKDKNGTYPFSSYTLRSFSLGLSHYFMPQNIYFSFQYRLFGQLNITKKRGASESFLELEQTFDSNRGLGIYFGKEWHTTQRWSLGLSFLFFRDSFRGNLTRLTQALPHRVQDIENVDNANSTYFGFVFSASYNEKNN